MNTHRFPSQALLKGFIIAVLVMLAFQSLGMNSLASSAASSHDFQEGGVTPPLALMCGAPPADRAIQIILMIDDSGSMRTNDRLLKRNESAKEVVDELATQYYLPALNSGSEAPDVQVAIIHFSNTIMASSDFIKLNSDGLDSNNYKWEEDQKKLHDEIDKNQQFHYSLLTTDFKAALSRAIELWQSIGVQAGQDDGTLRSIMFFTDGSPDEGQGPMTGAKLLQEMEQLRTIGKKLPKLNGIYVIGYKVGANYLTDEVRDSWNETARNLSTPQEGVPNVAVLEKEDSLAQFEEDLKKIKAFSSNVSQAEINAALSRYQNLTVNFDDNELDQLHVDKQSDIKFKFVDSSNGLGLPEANSVHTLEVTVSVTESGAPAESLSATRSEDNYQVSWTPKKPGKSQFEVVADLVDAEGDVLLNCSGNLEPVVDPVVITVTPSTVTPSTVTPSTVTPSTGTPSTGTPSTGTPSTGTPSPTPTPCTTPGCIPPPPCDCDAIWKLWFWPLAIVLVGLLIVLLVLRFRSEPKETEYQEERQDISRTSYWHLLFWPLLILLILLILNRWLWCCVIPLWLFLVLILIWIIFLLWTRFTDDGSTWRRLWWLVVILLLLLVLIWYIYFSHEWTFILWFLAILLVLILAIIIWPVPPTSPDDLTLIEGIGPQVAKLLNEKGNIYTFRELADADINDLNTLLNERGWKYMDPKTWPHQAELADTAKKSGKQEDWDEFYKYTAWVKDGIAPHEYNEPEKDRKPPEE